MLTLQNLRFAERINAALPLLAEAWDYVVALVGGVFILGPLLLLFGAWTITVITALIVVLGTIIALGKIAHFVWQEAWGGLQELSNLWRFLCAHESSYSK